MALPFKCFISLFPIIVIISRDINIVTSKPEQHFKIRDYEENENLGKFNLSLFVNMYFESVNLVTKLHFVQFIINLYFFLTVPSAFLAINAEASTENGNITKLRRLEINWYNIDDENKNNYR